MTETTDPVPENTTPEAASAQTSAHTPDLAAQLAEAQAQAAAAKDAQLRALADLENTRRRLEREAQTTAKYAAENLLRELINICDSLELGLKAASAAEGPAQALAEGMQITHRQLLALLEKNGVKALDPQGQPFNPDQHQAMSLVESAQVAPNHVVTVLQKGYSLHERLLRPAMVMVAKAPDAPAAS